MSTKELRQSFKLLVIEDNDADVRLIQEALADDVFIEVSNLSNGEDALKYLKKEGVYKYASRPNLILMDLNMPSMSGFDVLEVIHDEASLNNIPIIIFTSSSNPSDVKKGYELHANAYVVKPVDLDIFFSIMESIKQFWIQYVEYDNKN